MEKVIFVSNRLSVAIEKKSGALTFTPSVGGLATGLSSVSGRQDTLWIGWSGIPSEDLTPEETEFIRETLVREHRSVPIPLNRRDLKEYYYGFCNKIVWPLFHYFQTYVDFDDTLWAAYQRVNQAFFEKLSQTARPGDTIWIHDYQLLLLPRLIKEHLPESRVGFFLHIPFPSYEIFRLLPWRKEILEGIMGADLIGFHTYDYARHFISSTRRVLGLEYDSGYLKIDDRFAHVDVFPMGIDYAKYSQAVQTEEVRLERDAIAGKLGSLKIVLSVDRLDYSKGIPQRLRAFDLFLKDNPEYREKVTLVMIVAPSRTKVPQYMELKREVDELVSLINGKYGTMGWVPIWYFYRSMPFHKLTALYSLSHVLLVTPIRDGMNLIAKEYIAARSDRKGVLILSETAGAAKELGEAIIVNPSNTGEIAAALKAALEMPEGVQVENNSIMHERLRRYDIHYWTRDFLEKLAQVQEYQKRYTVKRLTEPIQSRMRQHYLEAERRLLLLDYDGTLVPFVDRPERARPDPELRELLSAITDDNRNDLVVISGRSKLVLNEWFQDLPAGLVAGHGVWYRENGGEWQLLEPVSGDWKEIIRPILEVYTDRTPGSSVEEKEYSLAWHYRKTEPELAFVRENELKEMLLDYTGHLNLTVMEGNRVLEIKNASINKGRGIFPWLVREQYDFLLAFGDDRTDEDMFTVLPETAWSVKVGYDTSSARYFVESPQQVRRVLHRLITS